MTWKNRIVEQRMVPLSELKANPLNWRLHPKGQREELSRVLTDVGVVQTVIVNRTTGNMVDGHLRVELAQEQGEHELPVTFVELTEAEEQAILLQLDPLAGMAIADTDKLQELVESVTMPDECGLRAIVEAMLPKFVPGECDDQARLDQASKTTCPACGHEF